ncbi:hypothetical protein NB689_003244 [Xanthomonas sacchari]|nr:hypothetical protein [Xanthomonas sacchari]
MRVDVRLQPRQPRMLDRLGRVVFQVGGGRARAPRIDEGEALVEAHVLDQLHGLVEVGVALAGEANDEVRADRDVRTHRAQLADLLLELQCGVAALHRAEDAVAAGLHRQVQIVGQLRHVAVGLHQRVAEFQRMRGGEADAADALDLRDAADQQAQVGVLRLLAGLGVGVGAAVGVDVLAEQVDLAHALRGELCHFHQHVLERAADLLAAGVGHHAERAVFGAAFHDRHEGRGAFGARLRQAVELLDLGEADVHLRLARFAARADQLRQPVQGLRAEHQVHVGRALDDRLAFLRGDAATDADDHRLAAGLQRLPAAELAEHLFLRLLTDRAGVDQDHVRFFGVVGQFQAFGRGEHVGHLGRVVLVHLATVGLDVQLAAHRRGCGGGAGGG